MNSDIKRKIGRKEKMLNLLHQNETRRVNSDSRYTCILLNKYILLKYFFSLSLITIIY